MGSRGDSGASGSDAGFENTTKSKLTKKNQKLVDTDFDERGKVKMEDKILPPSLAIFKGPLEKGSKVNRDFFTDKVLGSKNYKGTTKEDFANMTVSQQEQIYGDYMKGRQTGKTDAYGNQIGTGRDDSPMAARTQQKSKEQPKVASQMDNTGVKSDLITADKTAPTDVEMTDDEYNIATKKRGRKRTVLTSVTGDTTKPQLSKKTLLGV